MRSAWGAVAAALALLATAAPARAQSPPGWAPPPAPQCPPNAECGVLTPPLVESDPLTWAPRATYAFIRHTTSGPPRGTVVYNPGGPGMSAIRWARDLSGYLGADFDLLLFDPRGVGASGALTCGIPDDTFIRAQKAQLDELARCGQNLGARAAEYGTEAAADDLEAIRARLKLDRLDLYGQSYGTVLFTTYARRYPNRVRSLLLSGAYPAASDPWSRDRAAALRAAIRRVCARSGGRCRGTRVLRDIRRLAARLRRHPVRFTLPVGTRRYPQLLDEAIFAYVVFASSYRPARYGALPKAVRAALAGHPETLVTFARTELRPSASVRAAEQAFIVSYAVYCTEGPLPYDPAQPLADRRAAFARGAAAIRRVEPFSVRGWAIGAGGGGLGCLEWPEHDADPPAGGPLPKVPTLIVNGDLDAVATPDRGRALARQFPGARFINVPNVGHVPEYDPTGCVSELYWHFLARREVQAQRCLRHLPAVPVP